MWWFIPVVLVGVGVFAYLCAKTINHMLSQSDKKNDDHSWFV